MKLVSQLAGWPPQGGAGAFDSRAAAFASSPEKVIIQRVNRVVANRVDFTCLFEKGVVTFRFFAANPGAAKNMAGFIESNRGNSLQQLGNLDAPAEE
ncbi:MAG TPA: hypothetical protein VK716_07265 [Terracidiphilus sp.]|nr:hypothetical protein [Terracidiphilus sp.]